MKDHSDVESTDQQHLFLGEVAVDLLLCSDNDCPPRYVTLKAGHSFIRFKVDTGADVTCMDRSSYERLNPKPNLTETKCKLRSPGGELRTFGEFQMRTHFRSTEYEFRVVVVAAGGSNLLGRPVAARMGIVSYHLDEIKNTVLEEFQDCFAETGLLKIDPIRLVLEENVRPQGGLGGTKYSIPADESGARRVITNGETRCDQKSDGADRLVQRNGGGAEEEIGGRQTKSQDLCGLQGTQPVFEAATILPRKPRGHCSASGSIEIFHNTGCGERVLAETPA